MKKNMNLNEIGNRKPFAVPENYFEDFANNFEVQIALKPLSPLKLLRPWMYMAAMFLGVFFMSRVVYTVYTDNKIANAENYELYVMSQVNDVENLEYFETEVSETTNK
jgi:hypothetical protein